MYLFSNFWDTKVTDWLLFFATAGGALASLVAGAAALFVGVMTYKVNRQTHALQLQVHRQQQHDQWQQELQGFRWAVLEWENRQKANQEMKYLAEASSERLDNLGAVVRFAARKHSESGSTFSFIQTGLTVAEAVGFADVSIPHAKPWTRVYGEDKEDLDHQDVLVTTLHDRGATHNGTLVKLTWWEPELESSMVMGEPFLGSRQLEQFIYIPPTGVDPPPVFRPSP